MFFRSIIIFSLEYRFFFFYFSHEIKKKNSFYFYWLLWNNLPPATYRSQVSDYFLLNYDSWNQRADCGDCHNIFDFWRAPLFRQEMCNTKIQAYTLIATSTYIVINKFISTALLKRICLEHFYLIQRYL